MDREIDAKRFGILVFALALGYASYWTLAYFEKISILSVSIVLAGTLLLAYHFGADNTNEEPRAKEYFELLKITKCKGILFLINISVCHYLTSKLYPNLLTDAPDWTVTILVAAAIFISYWIAVFFCTLKDFFK